MAVSPKIIYLEADEEITSVVDKLRKTEFKKVVLVIPKEASLLQSVVNLKLLKRQADTLEKSIAVVTHDKVGRALAEKIGILASSKLEDVVNEAEFVPVPVSDIEEEYEEKVENSPLADTKEVIFKEKSKAKKAFDDNNEPDDIVLKEEPELEAMPEKTEWDKRAIDQPMDNLMPKLPKARLFAIIGGTALVVLSLAYFYIPRAKASIMVKAERKPVSIDFTGEKDAKVDTEKAVIPTQMFDAEKESSKKYPATGKKNMGEKASGKVRIYWDVLSGTKGWVAGTRISPTSNPTLVFVLKNAVTIEAGVPVSVDVEAEKPGEEYNGFLSSPFSAINDSAPKITCVSQMSGGSTKEVTVVTQGDLNSAKDALTKDATDEATTEFNKKAEEIKIIDETKKAEVVSSSASPTLNEEGTEFTMTVKVKVTALGYNLNDVGQIVKAEVERQLGSAKQVVDDGAGEAAVTVNDVNMETGKVSGTIKTDAFASERYEADKIKIELVGLNATKAENYLKGLDGIEEVKFQFFPSFIKSFPRLKNHIFINVEVANKENL